jgi:hypothetical protein
MLHLVGSLLIHLCTIPALLSVAWYARVPWWRSQVGRHLMSYMTVIAAVLALSSLRLLFGPTPVEDRTTPWFDSLRIVVFAGMPPVLWWRFLLIVKEQRAGRADRSGDETS